jgi:hypothetical protein
VGLSKGAIVPTIPLPEYASLEHLKKQAKLVRQLVGSGDSGALELVREFHPRFAEFSSEDGRAGFKLADAQLIVARLYGHSSWANMRSHVELIGEFTRPDPADVDAGAEIDRFVSLACLSYNGDHDPLGRIELARAMLDQEPGLATASVAAMAVTSNHRLLADRIEADPSIVDATCGPNEWPPLLYCCYSRLEPIDAAQSSVETVRLLIDAGADPNAGFLWHGLVPPFTALSGAFGRGEADQPPHRDAVVLARLLLRAGADPNDGQALYNNGLAGTAHDDPTHLELLVEFGLGTTVNGPWYRRFGSRLTTPQELLYDELEVAAHRGLPNRMQFLAGLDLELQRPVGRSRQTPWRLASDGGHAAVLAVLAQSGGQGSEESS